MTPKLSVCLVLPAVVTSGFSQDLNLKDFSQLSGSEIEQKLPSLHPAYYYLYANRLWAEGKRDEAVFWFYAGQLRFRFHLAIHQNIDKSGDPALLGALNAEIGEPLNLYIGDDPDKWISTLDRVLKWDAATPNGFTSKGDHEKELKEVRAGLTSLREYVDGHRAEIRSTREQKGIGQIGRINGVYIEERNEKMPKEWPSLVPVRTPEDIAGLYENTLDSLIGSIFFSEDRKKTFKADSIEVSASGQDSILVVAKKEGQELLRKIIQVRLDVDAVLFEENRADKNPDLLEGVDKETIRLRKNSDGELVFQRDYLTEGRSKSRGPIRYSYTFWNRAMKIRPPVPKVGEDRKSEAPLNSPTHEGVVGGVVGGTVKVIDLDFKQMKVTYQPPLPLIPPLAKMARIEGPIEVMLTVSPSGTPSQAMAVSGPKQLHTAAERSAMKWRFQPVMVDGVPQYVSVKLTITWAN